MKNPLPGNKQISDLKARIRDQAEEIVGLRLEAYNLLCHARHLQEQRNSLTARLNGLARRLADLEDGLMPN